MITYSMWEIMERANMAVDPAYASAPDVILTPEPALTVARLAAERDAAVECSNRLLGRIKELEKELKFLRGGNYACTITPRKYKWAVMDKNDRYWLGAPFFQGGVGNFSCSKSDRVLFKSKKAAVKAANRWNDVYGYARPVFVKVRCK